MNIEDTGMFLTQLAMGFGLAASVGLRAFLPLLAAGILSRVGYVNLGDSFHWMSSTPALVVFGSAVVFEVLADKIPGLDHVLHAVEAFVKPAAGTLVAASLFTNLDPMTASVLGLIGGGAIAGAVHAVKGTTRVVSTATTAGLGNPILSFMEDGLAGFGIVFALLLPILAALFILVFLAFGIRRLVRRRNRAAAQA